MTILPFYLIANQVKSHTLHESTLHPFNDIFSRTTWVSQCQKARTILDFNTVGSYRPWKVLEIKC